MAIKPLILTYIAIVCLLACSSTQPEPKGTLRLQMVTTAPQIDVYMYTMPDTIMRMNGTYQVKYLDMGILTLDNVQQGQYLFRLRGTSTLPNRLDTLITFDGKDRVILLRF